MHAARPLLVALLVPLAGCPDRTISDVVVAQDKIESLDIPAVPKRDIDILFLVDDSGSMKDEQDSLVLNFPKMIEVLESIEGGLPDVQIGVITPNLGTSAIDGSFAEGVASCPKGAGEAGALRALGAGGPRFIRDVASAAGGRDRNYSGTLQDAFSQLALVGSNGCGIEQHLEAIKRATDGSQALNAGFLRPDAYLAVVVIADEDDCSLQQSKLFDAFRGDPKFGEKTNFRCIKQGVVCEGDFEARPGEYVDCHPNTEPSEVALISRYVDHLKSLKSDPRDIVVAGIVGDPENFETAASDGVVQIANACGTSPTAKAFPAVRTGHLIEQFPIRSQTSICNADLSSPMTEIGARIKEVLVEPCFENDLADTDPVAAGPQYDCSVTEVRRRPGQADEELGVLPSCDRGGVPCWRVEEDAVHCGYTSANPHLKLVVERGGVPADPNLRIKASCVTTDPPPTPL